MARKRSRCGRAPLPFPAPGIRHLRLDDLHTWNMGYAKSGNDSVAIASTGKVSHVTKDLSSAQKAATVTWTLAAGAAE